MAERHGGGEPTIVALHGWARDHRDWRGTLDGLDAIALDLPGFGASPAPPEAWGTADYADFLAPLADDRPVVLVGHSFGGRVAVQWARRHPRNIAGVVLTGVPLLRAELSTGTAKPALAYRIGRLLHRSRLLSDARMDALRHKYGSADYRNATGVMRGVLVRAVNEDYTDQLTALADSGPPVRMVWGEHDTAAPVPMARHAAELLGGVPLTVVTGSAHLLDAALEAALRSELTALADPSPTGGAA